MIDDEQSSEEEDEVRSKQELLLIIARTFIYFTKQQLQAFFSNRLKSDESS
jgi:hypothetical protein